MVLTGQIPNYVKDIPFLKRILAILFLAVFLFNVIGYYAVYLGLRTHVNHVLQQRLDDEFYEADDLLTLKIPVNLPYQTDWHSFQRVEGDFERNGKFYNLVKQKVERDTLIVIYIKDHQETSLFESLSEIVHATTDTPMSKKAGKLIENFTKDYLTTSSELGRESAGWCLETTFKSPGLILLSLVSGVSTPPPKSLA